PVLLVRAPDLALYQLAEAIGDRPLACVTAVQIDERGARTAVAHTIHQLAQRCPGRSRQRIAGMAQIMEVRAGHASGDQERRRCAAPLARPSPGSAVERPPGTGAPP